MDHEGARLSHSLEESAAALRKLFAGERVTSAPGDHYAFDDFVLLPPPVQRRLPIMIGGSGEKKTLRTVARHADMWNAMGTQDFLRHKIEVLRRHCVEVNRDPGEVDVTVLDVPVVGRDRDDAWERVERLRGRTAAATYAKAHHAGTAADHRERWARLAERGVGTVFAALPDLTGPEDVARLGAALP